MQQLGKLLECEQCFKENQNFVLKRNLYYFSLTIFYCMFLKISFSSSSKGSQVLVPFRGSEDSPRHLKLMGDLGQVVSV